MDFTDLGKHVVLRWWVVAALAALAVLGAGLVLVGQADYHERTVHFVLRPQASVSNDDLPGALDALESDGPLVQSVIGVLDGDAMLRRAATDAGVPYRADFDIESTGRPGSALIDSTLTASSEEELALLAAAYARAASNYVGASYSAYVLARLSIESGGNGGGPSAAQLLIIAALAGALLGLALVAAELKLRRGVQGPAALAPAAKVPHARPPWEPAAGDGRPRTPPRRRVVEPLDVRHPEPLDPRPPEPVAARPPEPVAVAEPVAVPDPATRKAPARRPKATREPNTTAPPKRTTRSRRKKAKAASGSSNGATDSKPSSRSRRKPANPAKAVPDEPAQAIPEEHEG